MAVVKVLIVEDDAIVATHLKKMLLERGYQVMAVTASGEDAVDLAGLTRPDIILMDIYLQGSVNGIAAADHIRQKNKIPVIFITAYSDAQLLQQAKASEPYGYLTKPVRDHELFASIEMALYKHRTDCRLNHLMQVLRAVRGVNQLIVREKDPEALFTQACQIIFGTRDYYSVWMVRINKDPQFHLPAAAASQHDYMQDPMKFPWLTEPIADGPYRTIIENHEPVICNAIATDESGIPFRKEALAYGFSSVALIPMLYAERLYGVLSVTAVQPDVFDGEEIHLLAELANDLAFALHGLEEEVVRAETERCLRESEERYLRFADTASEGIWVLDPNLKCIFANPCLAEMIGYSVEEILGKTIEPFLFAEEIPAFQQRMVDRRNGKAERYELRLQKKDGSELWVIVSATPAFDPSAKFSGTLAMLTDITERKRAEEALQRRFVELSVIYENSLALTRIMSPAEVGKKIIHLISSKLNWHHVAVRLLNHATGNLEVVAFDHDLIGAEESKKEYVRLNGLIQEPGQGLSGWVVQHGESVCCPDVSKDSRYLCSYTDIRSGLYVPLRVGETTVGCISVESIQPDAFGENEERLLTTLALQASVSIANHRLYQAVHDELIERKRIEDALRVMNDQLEHRVSERTEELRQVNTVLERASRLKDEFLASMSHELRTPLTGVLNLSEVLQEQVYGPLNPKQLELTQTIESSGRHLLRLINDILDLSKIEAGQFELQTEVCSNSEICQSSLEIVKGMAQKKRISVAYESEPAVFQLLADPRRLKQMLVNLLSNAVKFTHEGGRIGLSVEADEEAQEAVFTVWDTGIGIASSDIALLFRPFTQLDGSLSRQQVGTGLGLALVKRMADMHGGSIHVQSMVGEGSRFTITLPWNLTVNAQPVPQENIPILNQPELVIISDDRPLILIADDNLINLETYSDYLRVKGYQVIKAYHGEEVVQSAGQNHPDLILMDIQMPGMDGLQAIQLIRASGDPKVVGIPILALTALAMTGDRERCLTAGANSYLSKPIALKELLHSVQQFTRKNGKTNGAQH